MKRTEIKYSQLVGISRSIQELRHSIQYTADSDINVLVTGETGTGKELVARRIHQQSGRRSAPFVPVLCNACPETLIDAVLFGHEQGAFTHATRAMPGKFRAAHGGTLFLDEVANIPQAVQAKLLRVLDHSEITPIGATYPVHVDFRLIAATNDDLETMVQRGVFRQDLLHRLRVFAIDVPPLRKYASDIPLLTEHYLSLFCQCYGRDEVHINKEAMASLQSYHWPGNVRELQNVIESALVRLQGNVMTPADLPERVRRDKQHRTLSEQEQNERGAIQSTLLQTDGNVSQAAKQLGLTRQSLYRRLQKYGIERP